MQGLLLQLILLLFGSFILVRTATFLVRSITALSAYFKLSEFIISFVVMGIVTSLPEISVAISSALSNNTSLVLGNVLGSNITNLTLVIAIPTIIARGIKVRSIVTRNQVIIMALFAIIPLVMLLDKTISRIDAGILFILYITYIFRLLTQRGYYPEGHNGTTKKEAIKHISYFAVGILFLFLSSQIVVNSSINIATTLGIPVVVIGLILVSAGTTLPELTHGLKAVSDKKEGQILGDIMGSVVANATLVLGLAAMIQPIQIERLTSIYTTSAITVAVLILFLFGVYTDKRLGIKEALMLLGLYIFFIFAELGLEIVHLSAVSGGN